MLRRPSTPLMMSPRQRGSLWSLWKAKWMPKWALGRMHAAGASGRPSPRRIRSGRTFLQKACGTNLRQQRKAQQMVHRLRLVLSLRKAKWMPNWALGRMHAAGASGRVATRASVPIGRTVLQKASATRRKPRRKALLVVRRQLLLWTRMQRIILAEGLGRAPRRDPVPYCNLCRTRRPRTRRR
jgi:hypothetical protein